MKVYQTNEIKNIALLGNDGSGKTTLTESLLFESGIIKRRGRITAKNTVSDYFPVEQEYGYSVFSTVYHVEWNGKKLNIIDCPGSDDFVGAAITALNVTDTAILLSYDAVKTCSVIEWAATRRFFDILLELVLVFCMVKHKRSVCGIIISQILGQSMGKSLKMRGFSVEN